MADAAVVTGSWRSTATAVREREEAVRDAIGGTHLAWDLRLPDPDRYACALRWHAVGDATVVDCRSGLLAGRRTPAEVHGGATDLSALLVVLAGAERVRQGEVAAELQAGDALLWHGAAPIDFEVRQPLHKVTLLVPSDRVAGLRPGGDLGPVALPGERGAVRLLAAHLRSVARLGGDLTGSDARFAVDVALDLLGRALDPVVPGAGASASARALVASALALIEEGLGDPDLGPATIAAALGVTPRYLHMVFAGTGGTVAAHIRRRRVARVRAALADPRCDGETVTELAFRWGFGDSGSLSRAFKAAHGVSPSAYRRSMREG